MKKFGKFLFGSAALAAAGAGVYCLYKKFIEKPEYEDDDEFLDDLDDYDLEEDAGTPKAPEYVSLNSDAADKAAEDIKEAAADLADGVKNAVDGISKAVNDITE